MAGTDGIRPKGLHKLQTNPIKDNKSGVTINCPGTCKFIISSLTPDLRLKCATNAGSISVKSRQVFQETRRSKHWLFVPNRNTKEPPMQTGSLESMSFGRFHVDGRPAACRGGK